MTRRRLRMPMTPPSPITAPAVTPIIDTPQSPANRQSPETSPETKPQKDDNLRQTHLLRRLLRRLPPTYPPGPLRPPARLPPRRAPAAARPRHGPRPRRARPLPLLRAPPVVAGPVRRACSPPRAPRRPADGLPQRRGSGARPPTRGCGPPCSATVAREAADMVVAGQAAHWFDFPSAPGRTSPRRCARRHARAVDVQGLGVRRLPACVAHPGRLAVPAPTSWARTGSPGGMLVHRNYVDVVPAPKTCSRMRRGSCTRRPWTASGRGRGSV